MATDGDLTVTKCNQCGGAIAAKVERPVVRVQANGTGGAKPTEVFKSGDVVELAYRKNGGAWQALPRQYEVKNSATPPNVLTMYVTLKFADENRGTEEKG